MSAAVAVVGAGVAGLAAARVLQTAGRAVVVIDKGRAPGGRVATRRQGGRQFDHGAQYFTVRAPEFRAAVEPLLHAGAVVPWPGPFRTLAAGVFGADPRPGATRFVGVPGMSALARGLAGDLQVRCGQRVDRMQRTGDGYALTVLELGSGVNAVCGPFAAVLLALPPAQAADLFEASGIDGPVAAAARAQHAALAPCLAALVEFAAPVEDAPGGLFVADEVLAFAAHDGGKPGRSGAPHYVLHGTASWSAGQLARAPDDAARDLVVAFGRALGRPLPPVVDCAGHRWRFALAAGGGVPGGAAVDVGAGLAWAGDAALGGRVESAYRSGAAAARQLLRR